MKTSHAKDWLLERLTENSTWRGLILIVTSCGIHVSPKRADAIIGIGLLLVGLVNVGRREKREQKVSSLPLAKPESAE